MDYLQQHSTSPNLNVGGLEKLYKNMTLESYSTLATKNYNFYAPWNRICGHLVFVNVCL